MGIVKAAFLVTVYAEDDDYATYASPARTDWSNAEVQSWLSQNYFERLEDALDVGDRPNTLSWTVDTLPDVEAALAFEESQWSLARAIVNHPEFRDFVSNAAVWRWLRRSRQTNRYRDFL